MRTANPVLGDKVFSGLRAQAVTADAMTLQGAVNKTMFLLLLLVIGAGLVWTQFFRSGHNVGVIAPWILIGVIGGLIAAVVTAFKPAWAPVSAPIYAALEGLAIGGISAIAEAQMPNVVLQAVALTFGVLFSMLLAYKVGVVRATEKFKLGVVAATGAIALVYIATMILGLFNVSIPYIHSNGLIGIGFSVFVVVIAALNLVLDFDFIEQGARVGAPKYLEWYGAFALMVTLIWLYIEILRLLSKIAGRRN